MELSLVKLRFEVYLREREPMPLERNAPQLSFNRAGGVIRRDPNTTGLESRLFKSSQWQEDF